MKKQALRFFDEEETKENDISVSDIENGIRKNIEDTKKYITNKSVIDVCIDVLKHLVNKI